VTSDTLDVEVEDGWITLKGDVSFQLDQSQRVARTHIGPRPPDWRARLRRI
jgi:hypothetical protein